MVKVIGSKSQPVQTADNAAELVALNQSEAFSAILRSIRDHAVSQGLSDQQAAFEVAQTFKRLDQLWADYLLQEGLAKLQGR